MLASFGATADVAEELLHYTDNRFDHSAIHAYSFPCPDEPFVAAWEQYARETDRAGSLALLSRYLVQLRFPIQSGISQTPDYIDATRRGIDYGKFDTDGQRALLAPQRCRIVIHPTAAGHIPLLIAEDRADFVALVQALTYRNEPASVSESMGACMVAGYNNWHRISLLRAQFEASATDGATWAEEFQKLKTQKHLYQDRFIILSNGPYSAVQASALGLDGEDWQKISLVIRREHECTHYFTRRVFSSMRNNLLDEIIADYCGIALATGRFRGDWLLRFLGLESVSAYREGGRLQNYRGDPPLSDPAFAMMQKLIVAAAENLEDFDRNHVPQFAHLRLQPALLMMLTALTIEEMASGAAQELMCQGLERSARLVLSGQPEDLGTTKSRGDHTRNLREAAHGMAQSEDGNA